MKTYFYFVSSVYVYGSQIAFANHEISRHSPVTSFEDIAEFGNFLANKYGLKHAPAIINYSLIRTEETEN